MEHRGLCVFPNYGDSRPPIPRWWPSCVTSGLKAAVIGSSPCDPAPFGAWVASSGQSRGATVYPEDSVEGEVCEGCDVGTVAPAPLLRSLVSRAKARIPTRTTIVQASMLRAKPSARHVGARPSQDAPGSCTDDLSANSVRGPTRHVCSPSRAFLGTFSAVFPGTSLASNQTA